EQSNLSALLEAARGEITALHSRDVALVKSIGSLEQQKRDLEAELHKSKNAFEQTKRDLEAELHKSKNAFEQTKRDLEAELHKSKNALEQTKHDLEAELDKSKNALQQSHDEATRLSSVVQNQKSLQERLDGLSRRISAA